MEMEGERQDRQIEQTHTSRKHTDKKEGPRLDRDRQRTRTRTKRKGRCKEGRREGRERDEAFWPILSITADQWSRSQSAGPPWPSQGRLLGVCRCCGRYCVARTDRARPGSPCRTRAPRDVRHLLGLSILCFLLVCFVFCVWSLEFGVLFCFLMFRGSCFSVFISSSFLFRLLHLVASSRRRKRNRKVPRKGAQGLTVLQFRCSRLEVYDV